MDDTGQHSAERTIALNRSGDGDQRSAHACWNHWVRMDLLRTVKCGRCRLR